MQKDEIAYILKEIGVFLELKGENPFNGPVNEIMLLNIPSYSGGMNPWKWTNWMGTKCDAEKRQRTRKLQCCFIAWCRKVEESSGSLRQPRALPSESSAL